MAKFSQYTLNQISGTGQILADQLQKLQQDKAQIDRQASELESQIQRQQKLYDKAVAAAGALNQSARKVKFAEAVVAAGLDVHERTIESVPIKNFDGIPIPNIALPIQENFVVEGQVPGALLEVGPIEGHVYKYCVTIPRAKILSVDPTLLKAKTMAQIKPLTDLLRQQCFLISSIFSNSLRAGTKLAGSNVGIAERKHSISGFWSPSHATPQQQLLKIAA